MSRTTPVLRLAVAALSVLVLLVVVALASRGGLGGGRGSGGTPSSALLDYGFTLFLIAYAISIPFTIWIFLIQHRERRVARARAGGQGVLANVVVFVSLVALAVLLVQARRDGDETARPQPPPALGEAGGENGRSAAPSDPEFQWPVLVAVAVAGGAAAAWYVNRRRRRPLREPAALATELGAALDDAIDDVYAETDPRRAVIRAYARLEQILAAHGLPRREAEAPYEYLARTLPAVDTSGAAVERLTALYERARFSLHEIDPRMREDAIAALVSVRDELRAAA